MIQEQRTLALANRRCSMVGKYRLLENSKKKTNPLPPQKSVVGLFIGRAQAHGTHARVSYGANSPQCGTRHTNHTQTNTHTGSGRQVVKPSDGSVTAGPAPDRWAGVRAVPKFTKVLNLAIGARVTFFFSATTSAWRFLDFSA